jgi:hypothetical protein
MTQMAVFSFNSASTSDLIVHRGNGEHANLAVIEREGGRCYGHKPEKPATEEQPITNSQLAYCAYGIHGPKQQPKTTPRIAEQTDLTAPVYVSILAAYQTRSRPGPAEGVGVAYTPLQQSATANSQQNIKGGRRCELRNGQNKCNSSCLRESVLPFPEEP